MQHIRREHFAVSFVLSKVHGEEVMKIFLQIVFIAGLGVFAVLALNHEGSPARLWDIGTVKDDVAISSPVEEKDVIPLADTQPIDSLPPVDEVEVIPKSEFANIAGAYEYFDEEGISPEAAEEYRQFNVLPYNPEETTCEDAWITEKVGAGLIYKKKCTSKKKYAPHPYYDHDIESLEEKAEFGKDPLAAAVAADRLADTDASRAVGLAIYSSLVSNKPGPIYDHAQRHFALKNIADEELRSIRMPTYYSLMKIAQDMGHPNVDLSFADSVPIDLRDEWARTAKKTHEELKLALLYEGYTPGSNE